ncbi:MAG: bifunctional diguanylate cyclase/phosphodiesterase, partial [Actinobacteria bacterium]|nr:bifunctional diguanylate cyclase/phosphodiesterase [Actinomycetota bacterium]
RVRHAFSRVGRDDKPVSVLFLDLDDFKSINDAHGHTLGDQLLVAAARRLRKCLRPSDTVARFGGDEFAILLEGPGSEATASLAAARLLSALADPFVLQGKEVFVHASIGVAVSGTGEDGIEELLSNADIALYVSKGRGKAHYEVFAPDMRVNALRRVELKRDLRRAIDNHEFVVFYQPTIALETRRTVGMEALVRWRHPTRGLVTPLDFIPLAEETGLVLDIGRYVLREACRQTVVWNKRQQPVRRLRVSVNLSARQVQEPTLRDDVAGILLDTRLDPDDLTLEITESVLMLDTDDTMTTLQGLKDLGVRLAIDDFGTGYSSLSYLERFPIDILKIDKAFVAGIGHGSSESALAQAVIKLGDSLGLHTIAEGIEDRGQLDRLLQFGCTTGQGFYFSPPLDANNFENRLAEETVPTVSRPFPDDPLR